MLIFLIIVQIIAESLPISSSGHVALVRYFLTLCGYSVNDIPCALLWAIHGVTALLMLRIMFCYWAPFLRHPWRTRNLWMRMFLYGICAELVGTVVYVACSKIPCFPGLLALGFFITACALYSLKKLYNGYAHPFDTTLLRRVTQGERAFFSLWIWIITGVAQGVAALPGCSRLALTYAVARWLGYSGRHAMLLSYTLALPAYCAASVYGLWLLHVDNFSYLSVSYLEALALLSASIIAYYALVYTSHLLMNERIYHIAWYPFLIACISLLSMATM